MNLDKVVRVQPPALVHDLVDGHGDQGFRAGSADLHVPYGGDEVFVRQERADRVLHLLARHRARVLSLKHRRSAVDQAEGIGERGLEGAAQVGLDGRQDVLERALNLVELHLDLLQFLEDGRQGRGVVVVQRKAQLGKRPGDGRLAYVVEQAVAHLLQEGLAQAAHPSLGGLLGGLDRVVGQGVAVGIRGVGPGVERVVASDDAVGHLGHIAVKAAEGGRSGQEDLVVEAELAVLGVRAQGRAVWQPQKVPHDLVGLGLGQLGVSGPVGPGQRGCGVDQRHFAAGLPLIVARGVVALGVTLDDDGEGHRQAGKGELPGTPSPGGSRGQDVSGVIADLKRSTCDRRAQHHPSHQVVLRRGSGRRRNVLSGLTTGQEQQYQQEQQTHRAFHAFSVGLLKNARLRLW